MKCSAYLFEFLQEWENNTEYSYFELDNKYISGGGNCNQYCSLTHCYFNTEARVAGRNVDMDRMSKSSPDISSDTTSSTSSTEGAGTAQLGGKYKIYKREKSPVIVITDEDYPTIVTHDAPTEPASPSIIIYDDEGTNPIVNLASSPIFADTGRAARGEHKTMMKKDSSSYFTPPEATAQNIADPDEFIKQIFFENVGVGLERVNLDLILSRTTWGGAHDVLEAARVGQYHRIPTAQAAAAILRIMPIIATRAGGGEIDAVNAVGLIKGRFDEFLRKPIVPTTPSYPSVTGGESIPISSGSGPTPIPSPAPPVTPDTPSYVPMGEGEEETRGGRAYQRARRYMTAQRGRVSRRRLPRMVGPTVHVGGWYHPPSNVPPYVPAYRAIPGWVPGMPRPPPPWQRGAPRGGIDPGHSSHSGYSGYQQYQQNPGFNFNPTTGQSQGPFYFGRGGSN